jgi:hypothetical protein
MTRCREHQRKAAHQDFATVSSGSSDFTRQAHILSGLPNLLVGQRLLGFLKDVKGQVQKRIRHPSTLMFLSG